MAKRISNVHTVEIKGASHVVKLAIAGTCMWVAAQGSAATLAGF